MATSHPTIANEWHLKKNGSLTAVDMTAGSNKKIWWQCKTDVSHEWQATIFSRTRGSGCPFCLGRIASAGNNLKTEFPKIAKQWHPEKNNNLKPENFRTKSHTKIWWRCDFGHDWEAAIYNRTSGKGCPFCAGQKVTRENSLATKFPEIAAQLHNKLNNALDASKVSYGSNKSLWWKCNENPEHVWRASVKNRTIGAQGCPFCVGKRVNHTNSLTVLRPDLAQEWNYEKNGNLRPDDFTLNSNRKVWWVCKNSPNHDWETPIATRSNGSNCPKCSKQTSLPEIRCFCEIISIFGDAISRFKIEDIEVDVYIPSLKLCIEYDGAYFHADKGDKDLNKNNVLEQMGMTVVRLREIPLKKFKPTDILVNQSKLKKTDIDLLLKSISSLTSIDNQTELSRYICEENFRNENLFRKYMSYLPAPFPEQSLDGLRKDISNQWDYTKNYPLRPENFKTGSHQKVWWKCEKDPLHSWQAIIKNRTRFDHSNCPFCTGRKKLV